MKIYPVAHLALLPSYPSYVVILIAFVAHGDLLPSYPCYLMLPCGPCCPIAYVAMLRPQI